MARARSPEYPAIGLKEAVERVKMVYDKDYQNRLPKKVVAEHMGYKSLSGASLPVLSALAKYGLLEGRGDETRVSDLAVTIIAHAPGTPERAAALHQAASSPELFSELDQRFSDGKASDQAIRSYLLTSKFIPGAADAAVRSYRDTKGFVASESAGYNPVSEEPESAVTATQEDKLQWMKDAAAKSAAKVASIEAAKAAALGSNPGMLQEVFNLDEGPVTFSAPSILSPESYQDMADRIEIFLRGLKRRSDAEAARRRADREDVPE